MADVTQAATTRRFWLRRKWIVGHVLVVVLVATFVSFGFWQLDRLDQRQARNADILARAEVPVAPVTDVVPAGAGLDDVEGLRYRRVSVTGTYDTEGEVFIRPRSLNGGPGWHVVTPLVLDDGRAVLVTRGFAPLGVDLDVVQAAVAPPTGRVTVTGLVFPTQERQGLGPTDPDTGSLDELARVDIDRIDQQYAGELLPVFVQLETQGPAPTGALPMVLPVPETDEGPHLAYAVQWFLFAGVGIVGWPVLLVRTAKEERRGGDRPPPGPRPQGGVGGGDGGGGGRTRRPTPDRPRDPVGADR